MAKSSLRLLARKMRQRGKSVGFISQTLGVSKNSASIWCRDITLSDAQRDRLIKNQIAGGLKGRLMGAAANRSKRLSNMAEQEDYARKVVNTLTTRDKLMLGIALYWGEGTKVISTSNTAITNSDPETILFARDWFEQHMGVSRNMFHPYIFISEIHKDRGRKILRFWSRHLEIPISQFAPIVFLKGRPKKIYDNHDSYYGVLALRVRKGKTLKYRILGLIKACKEEAGVAQAVRAAHS